MRHFRKGFVALITTAAVAAPAGLAATSQADVGPLIKVEICDAPKTCNVFVDADVLNNFTICGVNVLNIASNVWTSCNDGKKKYIKKH